MAGAIRWTITVSPETDLSLCSFLEEQGMKESDLSTFVEDAVRWRMFDCTVQAVKERNQDISAEMLEAMIDDAVREVHAECRK